MRVTGKGAMMARIQGVVLLALVLAACQADGPAVQSAPAAPLAAAAPAPPSADEAGRLHAFAQAACGGCHAIERSELSPNPKSPPFEDIANRRGLTADTLASWLRSAHNYPEEMDFDLDPAQADDLAAYIVTLQHDGYKPAI